MKKTFIFILTAIILLVGCAPKAEDIIPLGVSTEEIALEIMSAVEIPSAVQKTKDELNIYINGLDNVTGGYEVSYYICGSGAYPDELLIIRFDEPAEAENAKPLVQARLDSRKDDFRDYRPEEMYKLDSAVLEVNSNWLFYFVTEDNATAKAILDTYY